MLDSYIEEQPYFVEEIKRLVNKKRISHAYLLETRNCPNCDDIALSFAKYLYCSNIPTDNKNCDLCNLCTLIEENANSDFLQIRPDGSWIKKDQVLDIKEKFKTKPLVEGTSRIYIIYEAEKLNKQAANSLLKFLEEPEDNIIAILVTSNRYQVIETIRSRCQIFSLINNETEVIFHDFELICNIIKCIEEKKKSAIAYLPITMDNQYYGRDEWILIFNEMQYLYEQALRKFEGISCSSKLDDILDFIVHKNDEISLLHKLDVIKNTIEKLSYNLNMNLMLDDFIIKFSL